jgi:hypothetical protein
MTLEYLRNSHRHDSRISEKEYKKEKNQCPREGMFSGSFAKARGRDEG